MPKLSDMYPSKWLKASDCEEDLVLTIESIREEPVGQGSQADEKWIMYFAEIEKGLVLNKTNSNTIAKLYGQDTDDWIGKAVTLYSTEVQFQGDMVEAIRIRSKPPRHGKPKIQPRPAARPVVGPVEDSDEDIPF